MITHSQCHAARILTELSIDELSRLSGVPANVIEDFEDRIAKPDPYIISRIVRALEEAGAVFLPENGGGIGVRLKFRRADVDAIGRLENEGGVARLDDVP